jgi:dTMP kinase
MSLSKQKNNKVSTSGFFITFEGGEGSGKSTLLKHLEKKLSGLEFPTLATRAPGGTSVGNLIREILLHKKSIDLSKNAELFLFLADRSQHVYEVIAPSLREGCVVLCDRFNDSTIAYQVGARNGDLTFIEKALNFATNGVIPDLTFYLDIDPSKGLLRAKKAIAQEGKAEYDRLENEKLEFHSRVRDGYLMLCEKFPERIYKIDAALSIPEVVDHAWKILSSHLGVN